MLLQDKPTLYALWPDGTCARLGLEGAADTTLSTMLEAMVNTSNTPALASVLNKRLENITQTFAGNGSASAASQVRQHPILQPPCVMLCKHAACVCSAACCSDVAHTKQQTQLTDFCCGVRRSPTSRSTAQMLLRSRQLMLRHCSAHSTAATSSPAAMVHGTPTLTRLPLTGGTRVPPSSLWTCCTMIRTLLLVMQPQERCRTSGCHRWEKAH
jgi:hypothetical protein